MLDKEPFCLIAQAIYDDLLLSFDEQGLLKRHFDQSAVKSHQIFFVCRYPSVISTLHNHEDLKVISEGEVEILLLALAGTQRISVVLFQVQAHFQENILQLHQQAERLSYVCLFHECFVNATSIDLVTTVCTTLRRHLSRVHSVSKYQDFVYSPNGNLKKITKSIYYIVIHSSFTTGNLEVVSPCTEYSDTWLCNSSVLTSKIHEEIKSIPEVFRFRLRTNSVPLQTTLGVTDRCCVTFCVSQSKLEDVSSYLERVYQYLRGETASLGKQELQRIIPLIWAGSRSIVSGFFQHQYVTFLDCRRYSKQPQNVALSKVQEILISMDMSYYFQKRSISVLYAAGATLEAFRQAIFHEDIILPFGREEGCFQCKFEPGQIQDSWLVELQTVGSPNFEAYQIEDDGTLTSREGGVQSELSTYLSHSFDAVRIRPAIVHVQGKGQQKVVTFLAHSNIQPQIPCVIKDHQGRDRFLYYKQPDVLADIPFSNIHVKEDRIDHHVISQTKGSNHGARISAFFPIRRNDLSRKRFSRVKSRNLCINHCDVLCTILDEAVPICLVNHELATQDVAILLDLLLHKNPILNHHSTFLACPIDKPLIVAQGCSPESDTVVLPQHACIVHCHLQSNQVLTVFQPRFEDGQVFRCTRNGLQLSVYDRTDLVLFLTGQLDVFDLFKTAPRGQVVATWQVDTDIPTTRQSENSSFPHEFARRSLAATRKHNSPANPSSVGTPEMHTPSPQ